MSEMAIITHAMGRNFNGKAAVQNLNLNIPAGKIYGFLGPNGCGKSTTIRMLTGLLTPSSGQIQVLGYELPRQAEELRLRMGYMTQKFSLYQDLSVYENLRFVSQIYGFNKTAALRRIDELVVNYDLQHLTTQLAGTLSGGQKQRLALAAATLHSPDLLFLDEPTSAVDPENRREFWEKLFDLCEQGTTILVSTHYMDEAERCHALAILEQGMMRAEGSPQQLMQNMGANVLEVAGEGLRDLKKQLSQYTQVLSAAQLGTRLRVLIKNEVADPHAWLIQQIGNGRQVQQVRASLEDVFVTCTGRQHESA